MSMLRHLVVAIVALIGDLHLTRIWCAIALGTAIILAVYRFAAPNELSFWPGITIMIVSVVLGLCWEHRAKTR